MNPKKNTHPEPVCKDHTEPFSELRTIPTGWDLSEYLEAAYPAKEMEPSDDLVDPQIDLPAAEL